jgi:hypothetical protein
MNMSYSKIKEITTMKKKTEYEKKVRTQLDEFGAELEKSEARSDKAEDEADPWHHKQFEVLQEKHKQAKEKLSEFKESSDDAWEDMMEVFLLHGIPSGWRSNRPQKGFNNSPDS